MKLIALIPVIIIFAGCNTTKHANTSAALDAELLPPSQPATETLDIRLYDEPHTQPNEFCDRHTNMVFDGATAKLENRVGGTCEIVANPFPRTYTLSAPTRTNCGALTYAGIGTWETGEQVAVTIIDNRQMTCEIPIPGLFVVAERSSRGESRLYSHGQPHVIGGIQPAQGLNLTCSQVDTSARPYMTFLTKQAAGSEDSSISYVKSAFFGSEEMVFEQLVPGCHSEDTVTYRSAGEISIECAGDGDAGYLNVEKSGNAWIGAMVFPNSGIEGYDDTSIPVQCSEQ